MGKGDGKGGQMRKGCVERGKEKGVECEGRTGQKRKKSEGEGKE